jgi:hypothetical protein
MPFCINIFNFTVENRAFKIWAIIYGCGWMGHIALMTANHCHRLPPLSPIDTVRVLGCADLNPLSPFMVDMH